MINDVKVINERLKIAPENHSWSTGQHSNPIVSQQTMTSVSPVDDQTIASVGILNDDEFELVIKKAQEGFLIWRDIPAPQRGQVLRDFGDRLRSSKKDLGSLVSYEMGKSLQEGYGEVQEMIDICDFAV